MPIQVLPPEISSQIAAGEVIERPASVVKELIENALDAQAQSILITIQDAGRRLIEIVDDGVGIPDSELPLAVARYATSKLQTADDLANISTLGFRGEALASIGSVSKLTITSRTARSSPGRRLTVKGGRVGEVEKTGAAVGTSVRVENLFANVPARLKFLKSDLTERRVIDALVSRYALAYPDVRFRLVVGETAALQTSGNGDRRAVLAALYGVDLAKQMLDVLAEESGRKLSGFISPTSLTRSNRRDITFFINGRWIQDVPLTTALLQAYHTLLMVGRFPTAALFLEIPPAEVDVNVHPAKSEVRFQRSDLVFSFVQRAVRKAILVHTPVPQIPTQTLWGSQHMETGWNVRKDASGNLQPDLDVKTDLTGSSIVDAQTKSFDSESKRIPLLNLVGQVGATYLVAEGPDGLYLIDQHAAHERVLFEKLMTQLNKKNVPSQILLTPVAVQLPPSQATLVGSHLPILKQFGFAVEPFGPNTFQVRSLPLLLSKSDPASALRALVEDFEEDETPLQAEVEARLIARICKRSAVKSGQLLSVEEQRALLTELENCESPRTCPHGRPTMIHLSVDLLARQFGRKGAR